MRLLAISIFWVLAFLWIANGWASKNSFPTNVVLIVVDDLGYADLSCTGLAADVETPNLDRLASEGVRFTNAYTTAPICNASRIALMTGRYQQRQETYWYSGPGLHDPTIPTLAESMRDAGYATAHIGKFHHSARSDGPDGRGFPLNHGFDYLFGFAGGTKHYLRHKAGFQFERDLLHQGPMWVNHELVDTEGFTTHLFGEQARGWLRGKKDSKFFLHLSFNAVHNYTHQLPDAYLEENGIEPFPDWDPEIEEYWDWRGRLGYPVHAEGRNYYLSQLHLLDQEIGKILDELETLGVRQRTAIIVVSDNGGSLVTYANNEPLKGGKYTLYEGGVRTPMIVSFPNALQAGQVSNHIVSAMDLFPTICALASAPAPDDLDGINLMPLLEKGGTTIIERGPLYWDTGHQAAIRDGKWKLLMTQGAPNEKLQITPTPVGRFLFDLEADPGETLDLSTDFSEVSKRLEARLKTWQRSMANNPQSVE